MSKDQNMSVFTTRRDTPYIVDDDMAQLLLDSHARPEEKKTVAECARTFRTMNVAARSEMKTRGMRGMMVKYGREIPVRVELLSKKNHKYCYDFLCGNPAIDDYFRFEALKDSTAVTYLVIDEDQQKLLAAMTVSCSAIFQAKKKQFSTLLSAMEVAYFAVDVHYQGLPYREGDPRSLSHYLFLYFIELLRKISRKNVGASKIVLYSVPEAENFYRRLNFIPFHSSMFGDKGTFVEGCVPMYYNLN